MINWHACISTIAAVGNWLFATTCIFDSEPDDLRTLQFCYKSTQKHRSFCIGSTVDVEACDVMESDGINLCT